MNGSPPTMPKKTFPICLRFADQLVERVGRDRLLLHAHIDPAALAAEVAGVDDRDVQERREQLAAAQPPLVLVDRQGALEAHVVDELPEQPLVGFEQHALGELERREQGHGETSVRGGVRVECISVRDR